ncbi:MAG: EAL domain-containing protein [Hyphomicrobiaceae bacterium]
MIRFPVITVFGLILFGLLAGLRPDLSRAQTLEPILLSSGAERVHVTPKALSIDGQGDSVRVNTAEDADGVQRLMSVRAQERSSNPNWLVFALRNDTERTVTRWLTAERYDAIGSGVIWPDLDSRRLRAVTPSVGFVPQKVENQRADIFQITIEPGQTVTYVTELATDRITPVYIWKPLAYELNVRDRRLFNGIMLGITGLLGVFLTAIFAANHKAIFPSAALVAWCVLAYLCVDFGFWHKLLQLNAEDNAVYRAATEAAMTASLAIFLYTFLRLGSWHGFVRMLAMVWIVTALSLIFVAVIDPRLAATFARLSFGAIGVVGALLTLFLAVRGQDRALSLIPTWILFLVWLFGAATALAGQLSGDLVISSLVAGLTLIVVLLGFTVTQFAFGAMESVYGTTPNEQNLRSLAIDGAGAAVWEWHVRRDEVRVSPIIESMLGLNPGELSAKVEDFLRYFHPADQERFKVLLWSVRERGGGYIHTDFRLRHTDNSYRWFDLDAASAPSADRRTLRCVGLLRDVTDAKRAQSRLMQDAVHDGLTSLPNRELFLDRLSMAIKRVASHADERPQVIFIDIDKFKSVNSSYGLIVGDSLLLTVAKRLQRYLGPQDTLARVGGDQFAVLLSSNYDPGGLAQLAERLRRSIRSPIRIAGQDIILTGAIGIAVYDGQPGPDAQDNDLLKEAEIAMYRAKRKGADQIELFHPDMRHERDNRVAIESDLRQALERRQLKVLFQPIIYLQREELAGFEALVRWEHPRLGLLNPSEFIPVAEESDLIVKLGTYVLMRSVEQAAKWQKELPRSEHPLFVSVNVSSKQLFRQDLIQEIRHIIGRAIVPDGVLRLEITETLVMENPEQATEMLESLRSAGARLALDDFGSGYSSLTYLQRFPFDTIKIDRDLIQAQDDDSQGSAIVRSIVALSHELGKRVVAEGVESAADVSFLRAIGCEYAQGFYYGEPMTDREVADLLRVVRKSERKVQRRGFFRTTTKGPPDAQEPLTGEPVDQPVPPNAMATMGGGAAKGALLPPGQPPNAGPANGLHPPPNQADKTSPQFRSAGMRTRKRSEPPRTTEPANKERSLQDPVQVATNGKRDLVPRAPGPGDSRKGARLGVGAPVATNAGPRSKDDGRSRPANGKPPRVDPPPPQVSAKLPAKNGPVALPPPLPLQKANGQGATKSAPPHLPPALPGADQSAAPTGKRQEPKRTRKRPSADLPDLSNLPPGIASSLAKLAGTADDDDGAEK